MSNKRARYRVSVVEDPDPQRPEGDGLPPIVTVTNFGEIKAYYVGDFVPDEISDQALSEAFERLGNRDLVARWLRMFHGVTRVQWLTPPRDRGVYMVFDAPQWRDHVGVTPEDIASEDLAHDWRAWFDGEVYGIITEVCDRHGVWHEMDAVYGYYGHDYAVAEAKETEKHLAARPVDDDDEPAVEVEFEYTVKFRARTLAGVFDQPGVVVEDGGDGEYVTLLKMMDNGEAVRVDSRIDILTIDP